MEQRNKWMVVRRGVRAVVSCTAVKVQPKEGDDAQRSKYMQVKQLCCWRPKPRYASACIIREGQKGVVLAGAIASLCWQRGHCVTVLVEGPLRHCVGRGAIASLCW